MTEETSCPGGGGEVLAAGGARRAYTLREDGGLSLFLINNNPSKKGPDKGQWCVAPFFSVSLC